MENKQIPKDQAQRDLAVNTIDSNVLVSASAGSGKTFIMTQKVAKLVSGEIENCNVPQPISNMMIVTFTRASAKDLKIQVTAALIEAIQKLKDDLFKEKDPQKKEAINAKIDNLKEQMEDVATASISTIDSLCSNIVREYSDLADVDPSFTIMEEDESNLSLAKAIKNVMKELNNNPDEDYLRLYKFFGEDDLKDALTKSYKFVRNNRQYLNYLDNDAKALYANGILNNDVVKEYFDAFNNKVTYFNNDIDKELEYEFAKVTNQDTLLKLNEAWTEIKGLLSKLEGKSVEDQIKVCQIISFEKKLPAVNTIKPEDTEVCKKILMLIRDAKYFLNDKDGMCKKYAALDLNQELENGAFDGMLVNRFIEIIKSVDSEYSELKKADNKLDFNDIEQIVSNLLDLESGEVKEALRAKYNYLFVDECQDVNPLQDYIMKEISNGKNLFMVGDIKQSIYGFRLSDPSLFLGRYKKYLNDGKEGLAVELNTNFRSKQGILDFANDVFAPNMTDDFGGIDYKDSAMLNPIGNNAEENVERVKIAIFSQDEKDTIDQLGEDGLYSVDGHNYLAAQNKNDKEAQYIVNKINALIESGDYKYNDITILFRSRSKQVENIVSRIRQSGIPIDMSNAINESKSSEISTLISLLNVIDNDKQDVPLTNVLLSVFGGFTPTELAKISKATPREKGKIDYFHQAFDLYERSDDIFEKINKFKERIEKYRFDSQFMSVADLLEKIVDETRYDEYVLAQEDGDGALNQIKTFIMNIRGKAYNSSISKFLSTYREYDSIDSTKEVFNIAENCVKTATIHASKGLQYKVVFLVDVSHGQQNDTDKVILQKDAGIVFKHFDEESLSYDKGLPYVCAQVAKKKEEQEEMMRALYVALTRAKEYMYITGTNDNELPRFGDLIKRASSKEELLQPQDASSMYDWIRYASSKIDGFKTKYLDTECLNYELQEWKTKESVKKSDYVIEDNDFVSKISELTLDKYPYKDSAESPLWYSVTQINKQDVDDEEETPAIIIEENLDDFFSVEEKQTSPEAGTAYHRVLELLDFSKSYTKEDIDNAMKQMVKEDKLTQEQYLAVKAEDIKFFLDTDLIQSIKNSKCLKEQTFRMYTKLPKEILGKELKDKVLLQGTFDLFIPRSANNDKGILVDYKFSHKTPQEIVDTYKKQIYLYKLAIEKCLDEQVDKMYIYVLGQNTLIEIQK